MSVHHCLCSCFCSGEVGESRSGAAEQTPPHGQESGPEPVPVPGLVCAQPGVQCDVLHPGAAGRLNQPAQRPLDPERLRRPAAQPHLLVRKAKLRDLFTLRQHKYDAVILFFNHPDEFFFL